MSLSDRDRAERYLKRHPDADAPELAGALGIAPDTAAAILDGADVPTADADAPSKPDDDGEAGTGQISPADHYDRVGGVYGALGEIGDAQCPGNHDFTGWYNERAGRARAFALAKEWPAIRERLDRVTYAAVNYAPNQWFLNSWTGYEWGDSGREWDTDETPTPGYGDLSCYAPFADIDLTDEVKRKRPDGDAPKKTIEKALSLYLEAFADLAGGMEHVYALDSVGGAYAFVAPTATAPIAELLDKEAQALLFDDMTDRLNEWLQGVKTDVNDAVPDAVGTFEPDLLNNKNRLYKAPMSIHSSLDGVVTPVGPENPSYDFTPLEAVDDALIADAKEWADGFTSDHRGAVSGIVGSLWPDYSADAEDWQDAVRARVSDLIEEREANKERSRQTLTADDVPDDLEETDEIEIVNAAIEAIDCRDVARDVAAEWDTDPGRDPPRFDPPWRPSDSGTSCYADRDKYVDLKEGAGGGGPLALVARASGILRDSSDQLRGDDYWRAVSELRKLGYEIPRFTGQSGTHPDGLGLFEDTDDTDDDRRKALRAMRASNRS